MLTKEEKILLAAFTAAFDVTDTPLMGFEPEELDPWEVSEVLDNGVTIERDGKKICIIPDTTYFIAFNIDEHHSLSLSDWNPTDEEMVEILKEKGFHAPWVTKKMLKESFYNLWHEDIDI